MVVFVHVELFAVPDVCCGAVSGLSLIKLFLLRQRIGWEGQPGREGWAAAAKLENNICWERLFRQLNNWSRETLNCEQKNILVFGVTAWSSDPLSTGPARGVGVCWSISSWSRVPHSCPQPLTLRHISKVLVCCLLFFWWPLATWNCRELWEELELFWPQDLWKLVLKWYSVVRSQQFG